MNGAMIIGRTNETIFIRLPIEQQRVIVGGCKCDYCCDAQAKDPTYQPRWDTLAIAKEGPRHGNDYAFTVHMPRALVR